MSWLKQTFAQTIEDQTLLNDMRGQGVQMDLQRLYGEIKSSLQYSINQTYAGAPGSKNKWMLAGPPGSGALSPEEAVHLITLAVIQLAGKEPGASKTIMRSWSRAMGEGLLPELEVQWLPGSKGANDDLQVTLDGRPLFKPGSLTNFLRTSPGYEATLVSAQNARAQQIDPMNMANQMAGQGDNAYLAYARRAGYLVHNTLLMVDNKQIMVPYRGSTTPGVRPQANPNAEQATYRDDRGRLRYVDDDTIAENAYDDKSSIWDKRGPSWEFSIGGPLKDRITEIFPFLGGYRPTADAEARKFSQKAAFVRLVQELGLETVVDMSPPPVNTGAKYVHLRQYENAVLQSLIRNAPQGTDKQRIEQAFKEGATGVGL